MTPKPLSTEFVQEFTRVQRPLYLYILAQIGSVTDAEEILQEANVDIVAKCDQFEPVPTSWLGHGKLPPLKFCNGGKGKARDRLRFSDEFVSAIAHEAAEHSETSESERNALEHCLKKLRPSDRKLIQSRYQPGSSGKDLAEQLGRPANSVYQSLGRIRRMLLECIQRQLALRSDPT